MKYESRPESGFSLSSEQRVENNMCDLVASDVELSLASVCVALEQHGAHAEDLLHHGILPQVILALFTTKEGKGHQRTQMTLKCFSEWGSKFFEIPSK